MGKSFGDLVRLVWPLSSAKRGHLVSLSQYLSAEDLSLVKYWLKLGRVGVSYESLGVRKSFDVKVSFPQLVPAVDDDAELLRSINPLNDRVRKAATQQAFGHFAERAAVLLPSLIAPHIVGLDDAKLAACLQLFCPERIHILFLGDPGTGKTDILRGASQFAPISSFGLGSGTSGVGLSAAKKGKELQKGLLPLAHKGVCCIDELNLMKHKDRGALLNAMEKGFVTYSKAGSHVQLPAEVRILATANPKGDRFIGEKVSFLKEQLPFDPALLSRFHLIFFIRRPSKEEFRAITRNVLSASPKVLSDDDLSFVKSYVQHAQSLSVAFDRKLEPLVTGFFDELKDREDEVLIELSPRLVLGVVRLSKAVARMSLRDRVVKADVQLVLDVLRKSLLIPPDNRSKKSRS